MKTTIERFHDISAGHVVSGHKDKQGNPGPCSRLHGHNYRIYFTLRSTRKLRALDGVGRVVDFSVIKEKLCSWLETHFDHRFLIWKKDPRVLPLSKIDSTIVVLPCNPTAENLAAYLVEVVGPAQLRGTGTQLVSVRIEETRKCSAFVTV